MPLTFGFYLTILFLEISQAPEGKPLDCQSWNFNGLVVLTCRPYMVQAMKE